jgi:hypothetical protein
MDTEGTTSEFRDRYLRLMRDTADNYSWPVRRNTVRQ